MNIKNIGLGWITVKDMAKAKHFFADTLGLKVISDNPEFGWMELKGKEGDMSLGVGAAQPEHGGFEPGHNTVLTFTVDDIVAAKQELIAKGVTLLGDIMEVPGHVKMLTFIDPDKNVFQLCEKLD